MVQSPLLDMVFGYMPARVLFAAGELRVADSLASGLRTSEELAAQAQTHARVGAELSKALSSNAASARQALVTCSPRSGHGRVAASRHTPAPGPGSRRPARRAPPQFPSPTPQAPHAVAGHGQGGRICLLSSTPRCWSSSSPQAPGRPRSCRLAEWFYARHHHATVVQVSPAELHEALDGELATRGYRRQAPTLHDELAEGVDPSAEMLPQAARHDVDLVLRQGTSGRS